MSQPGRFDRPRMPLADLIMIEPVRSMPNEMLLQLRNTLAADDVHRVVCDEVFHYCQKFHSGTEILNEAVTLAPPFRSIWLEGRTGKAPKEFQFGILCLAAERDEVDESLVPERLRKAFPFWRWALDLLFIVDTGSFISTPMDCTVALDYDGRLFKRDDSGMSIVWATHEEISPDVRMAFFNHGVFPLLLAIGFMHCSNVTHEPMVFSRKKEREFQRSYGRPFLAYKTIRVVPFKPVHVPLAGDTGEERPWHMVRGHFADYRERGLFGRHKGIYWIPEHGRGNRHIGEIRHDYEVMQPENVDAASSRK
jgi:hypothetical protein